jgi:flavin-dependent dehydrogenase
VDANPRTNHEYDYEVAICGGGIAGQALARQLKIRFPDISVVLIDKLQRPLPAAAFKVGESSVETGAHYLSEILDLKDYFGRAQLPKLGLRYFFRDAEGPFHRRPELGLSKFPEVSSYQIDRGVLENDLRQMNADAGVVLLEGYDVLDMVLSGGDGPHKVVCQGNGGGEARTLTTRWLVDATGRRRFIQKKLKLARTFGKPCSSVWWRLAGRIDVCDLVPREHAVWHQRVPNDNRYYSTTHLMDDGYWVWLIPLSSGNTSVGIVVTEEIHPFETFNTYERALEWLRVHEPELWTYVKDRTPMDFLCRRKYSYSSRRVFSHERWACVGEAGVFADPYYSPGNDMIGFANSITTELIRLDREAQLTAATVDGLNLFFLSLNNFVTQNIQVTYPIHGRAMPMFAKTIWDFASAWGFVSPLMFNQIFLKPETWREIRKVTAGVFSLRLRMHNLFAEWAARSPGRGTFEFIDYLSIPFLKRFRTRNLRTGKSAQELVEDHLLNTALIEELALVLFLLAVEDVLPERLADVSAPVWLNAWAIGLSPETWQADGLFQPTTAARDLSSMREEIRSLFRFSERWKDASAPSPSEGIRARGSRAHAT